MKLNSCTSQATLRLIWKKALLIKERVVKINTFTQWDIFWSTNTTCSKVHNFHKCQNFKKLQFDRPLQLSFFFYLGFLSRTFTIQRTVGEGEAISLTPSCHYHLFHRHLDISREITAECFVLIRIVFFIFIYFIYSWQVT